jgi:hypothetical protein
VYDNLSDSFDSLQEEIIGTSRCGNCPFPIINTKNTQIYKMDCSILNSDKDIVEQYKVIATEIKNILSGSELNNYISTVQSGINNTKEEILTEINKSLYLISMINI